MAIPKIANKKNVRNEKTSICKHEKKLCKSLFLILGFDPASPQTIVNTMKTITVLKKCLKIVCFSLVSFAIINVLLFWGNRFFFTKSFDKLQHIAELAVNEVGGGDILAFEADLLLTSAKENEMFASDLRILSNGWEKSAPNIDKLTSILEKSRSRTWLVMRQRKIDVLDSNVSSTWKTVDLPEHVVVRFGSHYSYAWLLIFPPDNTLIDLPNGVVYICKSVYLSRRNI